MVMTWVWTVFIVTSAVFSIYRNTGAAVTSAALEGAANAVELCITIGGPLCLWNGIGKLMDRTGVSQILSKFFSPILHKLFPAAKKDSALSFALSANFCANLLGLGNAATPMGIQAVRRMVDPSQPDRATDQMCRLVVLNTASIQLLPTTVAAVRQSAGAANPWDILPCVWISSLFSVSMGLIAAYLFAGGRHE